jgi:hypothetical protein
LKTFKRLADCSEEISTKIPCQEKPQEKPREKIRTLHFATQIASPKCFFRMAKAAFECVINRFIVTDPLEALAREKFL